MQRGWDWIEKALEAVEQWRFQPALKDGEPVAVQIVVETNFHLYGDRDKTGARVSGEGQRGRG